MSNALPKRVTLPEIKHCLICEDIRLERRGLVSFMGVYGFTPHAGISVRNFKAPVGFCLVFTGDPIEGGFDIQLEIRAPDGTRIQATTVPEHNEQEFSKELPCTFAFRVQAVFPGPDTYTMILLASGAEFFKDKLYLTQGKASDFA